MFAKIDSLAGLLEVKLQGLYDAEKQLARALPKLAAQATDPHLKMSLEVHLRETTNHVARLEQVAKGLDMSLQGPRCKAMAGLLEEGEQLMTLRASAEVMDAAIISAAQGVEHYEIAQYGTVVHFAKRLGLAGAADILSATLAEEKNTDAVLNRLAISTSDEKALR